MNRHRLPVTLGRAEIFGDIVTTDSSVRAFQVNRRLLFGGVALMGIGGLVWVTGATATSAALGVAVRRWVQNSHFGVPTQRLPATAASPQSAPSH